MSIRTNEYFDIEPRVRIPRSKFDRSHTRKSTWNNGDLQVLYCDAIIPGDTIDIDVTSVVRMSTPVKPIMDNLVMDIFYFFVPSRLLWNHFEEFIGANKTSHWTPPVEYQLPHLKFPDVSNAATWSKVLSDDEWRALGTVVLEVNGVSHIVPKLWYECLKRGILADGSGGSLGYSNIDTLVENYSSSTTYGVLCRGFSVGSLADSFGDPIGVTDGSVDGLRYRGYGLIWNTFFRDQNYLDPVDIHFNDDSDLAGTDWQQPGGAYNYVTDTVKGAKCLRVCRFHDAYSSVLPDTVKGSQPKIPIGGSAPIFQSGNLTFNVGSSNPNKSLYINSTGVTGFQSVGVNLGTALGSATGLTFNGGLSADLSQLVGQSTMQDLRTAFQILKFKEMDARSGSLYKTIISSFYGVDNGDARLQLPEYLGGSRHFLNVTQVLQTSSTDLTTPQGNTAAYSLTVNKSNRIVKSFSEFGYFYCLACTRTTRSYQQGINPLWQKRRRYDLYWPQFAHLSEQPVKLKSLYNKYYAYAADTTGTPYDLDDVFGYQEIYYEYRYFPDQITGDFRSDSPQSLDFWHFADDYILPPVVNANWLLEGPENVDRTLAVTSKLSNQFIGDFHFDVKFTRPMPLYSIPGLADHF